MWKSYFYQFNNRGFSDVRQAESLVHEHISFEVGIAIEMLKSYKSQRFDQIWK
jgi:hypothetical protein